jgi:hypothetical protein
MNCLPYIRPEKFDIFITDVLVRDLSCIKEELAELKLNCDENTYPIVSRGVYSRLYVCLPIEDVLVVFLLGVSLSPYTYIVKEILKEKDIKHTVNFKGRNMLVYPSHGYFEDLNILGGNWFNLHQAAINFDYKTHEGFLTFK